MVNTFKPVEWTELGKWLEVRGEAKRRVSIWGDSNTMGKKEIGEILRKWLFEQQWKKMEFGENDDI